MRDRLREALEWWEELRATDRLDWLSGLFERVDPVLAAARRFLALTETGPDYEAAKREFLRLFPNKAPSYDLEDRMLVGEVIQPIVDAALADYLTEEE